MSQQVEAAKKKVSGFKDTKAGKVVFYGGGLAVVAVIIIAIAIVISRAMQAAGKANQNDTGQSGQAGGAPSIGWFTGGGKQTTDPNVPVAGGAYDFGWVDSNDKKGLQTVQLDLKYIENGVTKKVRDSQIMWKNGMEFEVFATGKVVDSVTQKGVGQGWGYKAHIFDADHNVIAEKQGQTEYAGFFNFNFKLKPTYAGIFRCRVAAGDAANEEKIVFWLPAAYDGAQQWESR